MPHAHERGLSNLELVTLPIRTAVLLLLLWSAYSLGYGDPVEEWRKESPGMGVVARYSRNGRPWRIFYDRNFDRKWDMWIDERDGPPLIVSIDDNGDGEPDRDEDEFGQRMDGWRASTLRAQKSVDEFFSNPRRLQYAGLAFAIYIMLEFGIRVWVRSGVEES